MMSDKVTPMRKPNEQGRRPGDPSLPMLQLMRRLCTTKPDERTLQRVGPSLYAEAYEMIRASRNPVHYASDFWANEGFPTMLFCGHWITPALPPDEAA
jgi:hypothetical protein